MQFIALRFFTVYGPRQRPDLAIHKFAQRMADGAPIAMYGDGSTRRDYTYIADIVEGILAAIAHPEIGYEVINLGNSVTVSLREMIRTLERTLGMRARVNEVPAQPGDVPQTWASIEKAREVLNWHPHVAFDEGMEMFGHWFREGRP
jgi:UDP-glucuronate 4-epimerase